MDNNRGYENTIVKPTTLQAHLKVIFFKEILEYKPEDYNSDTYKYYNFRMEALLKFMLSLQGNQTLA